MRSAITLATLALSAGTAWAHPGHGFNGGSYSFVHYLTEPQHLGVATALALLAAISVALIRKARAVELQRATRARRP